MNGWLGVAIFPLFIWFTALIGTSVVISITVIKEGGSKIIVGIANSLIVITILTIILLGKSQKSAEALLIVGISIVLIIGELGIFVYGAERG